MDTRFSYRPRSVTTGRRRLFFATIFVAVLFLFDMISGGKVRALVRGVVVSADLTLHRMSATIFENGYFSSRSALEAQVKALSAQVADLEEKAALAGALREQVNALSGVTHLAQSGSGVTAPVASSFIASPYGTFLIGAGSVDGISPDSIVLDASGVVVGSVSAVGPHTATVVETFAPGHSVDALLDGAPIIAKGVGGGNATALVPHGVAVSIGDPVTAPGFEGRVIGVVGHFDTNPSSAAMQVYIGSPVNRLSLQYVFVVSPLK